MCVCVWGGGGGIRGITRLSLWQLSRVSECTFIKFHLNGALVTHTIVKTLKTEITAVFFQICFINSDVTVCPDTSSREKLPLGLKLKLVCSDTETR